MTLFLAASCTAPPPAPTAPPPATPAVPAPAPTGSLADVPAVSAQLLPSVVKILTSGGNGSGVVYTANGLILTNEHVVRGATDVQIGFADGRRYTGTVRAVDVVTDLALVQAERRDLPVARFEPELPEIGELAIVIGSPLGFENSFCNLETSSSPSTIDRPGAPKTSSVPCADAPRATRSPCPSAAPTATNARPGSPSPTGPPSADERNLHPTTKGAVT